MLAVNDIRIDFDRFWSTIERSAEIGKGRPGGLSRLALTDADRTMRDQFVAWCRDCKLDVRIDAVGNISARRPGRNDALPSVVIGSHLDTQINGGRFDGVVGVFAGLEICRALDDAGRTTERPIEILNWTNEEGARFSPPMVGSGCFTGAYALEWVYARAADDGATFGAELERIGYRGDAAIMKRPFDCYFEFHIEQGPILDAAGMQVGVVTRGYPSHGMIVEYKGETAHTGPWPMERRRNALLAGARFLVAVDDIGWEYAGSGGKGTAARLVSWPNKPGILSDWAQATCDVRHSDPITAGVMAERMRRAAAEAALRAGCSFEILDSWSWGGNIFDAAMVGLVRDSARQLGYRWQDIESQAGHDAYFMARHCPTTMIFSPCRNGITHNNNELCTRDDLAPGIAVLLRSVLARADG